MDDECDEMMYVPDGCDVCGDAAAEFCGIPTDEDKCAELEAKYPECDDEYEGEMHCEPSDEDMAYYQENCEDDEEEVDCDDCVSRFARAGGCECWMDDECDEMMYVPDGCDVCADAAAEFCGIPTDEETEEGPCADKACGEDCTPECPPGLMCPLVMQYCQPDGTCGMNSKPECHTETECSGMQGDHMCTCENDMKYAIFAPMEPTTSEPFIVRGRRHMAVYGEDMYCERANSCIHPEEQDPGFAGPIGMFWDCLHIESNTVYDVTTYFPVNGDEMSEDGSAAYCEDFTFHCGEESSEEPQFCCRAYTIDCVACTYGLEPEDFCEFHPEHDLCPTQELPCTGMAGDHACVCESGVKVSRPVLEMEIATEEPFVVYGRRRQAIRGQEMYCGMENSCIHEQEMDMFLAGPIDMFHDCLHMETWETYDVTTYFPMYGEEMAEGSSLAYCSDYTFHCVEEELPKCECEGWQSGSVTGDEMCAFQGGVNCALKYLNSEWDEGCPDNAFHCVLEIPEEPECPEVMCFMHCESGYVQDENGCDTCECVEECVDNADFANARGQTCEVIGKKFAQKGKECTTDALFENCCATCASLKEEPEPEPICEDGEEDNSNPCQPATCFDGMWMSYHIDCAEGWVDCQVDWVPPAEGECCSTCPCWDAVCTAEVCLDGTPAPIPEGECCGDVSLCPKIETCPEYDFMPELGSDCSMYKDGLSCEYGSECCCDECHANFVSSCMDGMWSGYNTDACMNPECPPRSEGQTCGFDAIQYVGECDEGLECVSGYCSVAVSYDEPNPVFMGVIRSQLERDPKEDRFETAGKKVRDILRERRIQELEYHPHILAEFRNMRTWWKNGFTENRWDKMVASFMEIDAILSEPFIVRG